MPMSVQKKAYRDLHIAVFLFGFTAILGDLIDLKALPLVWWRVLLTSGSLLFLIKGHLIRKIPTKVILQYMGIGVIVALHWLTFYGAIKMANASIALVCLATTSFFTALLEPLLLGKKVRGYELALGLLIIPGMALIVQNTDLSMLAGIGVGLSSALFAALFSILNKKMIAQADEMSITFIEIGSAWLFLSLVLPFVLLGESGSMQFWPSLKDWAYLLVLALLCTTWAYILALKALHHLSAFASNLTINLEPVYGVILAYFLLNDSSELSLGFYIGGLLIVISVFSYPLLRKRFENGKVQN